MAVYTVPQYLFYQMFFAEACCCIEPQSDDARHVRLVLEANNNVKCLHRALSPRVDVSLAHWAAELGGMRSLSHAWIATSLVGLKHSQTVTFI